MDTLLLSNLSYDSFSTQYIISDVFLFLLDYTLLFSSINMVFGQWINKIGSLLSSTEIHLWLCLIINDPRIYIEFILRTCNILYCFKGSLPSSCHWNSNSQLLHLILWMATVSNVTLYYSLLYYKVPNVFVPNVLFSFSSWRNSVNNSLLTLVLYHFRFLGTMLQKIFILASFTIVIFLSNNCPKFS